MNKVIFNRVRKKKIFCGGICKIWERSHRKCVNCNLFLCGICEFQYHNKIYCINCFLEDFNIKKDLKNEYYDILKQLEQLKKEREQKKLIKKTPALIKNEI